MIDYERTMTEDGISIVSVEGWFDNFSCHYFLECMDDLLKEGHREIVIDCENLGAISSGCLGNLIRAQLGAKNQGGRIVLANVNNSFHEVIKLFGLTRLFGIYSTLDVALSKTRGRSGRNKITDRRLLSSTC